MQYLKILLSSFGEEDFLSLVNRNQIFAFFLFSNFCRNTCRWSFTIILTNYDGLNLVPPGQKYENMVSEPYFYD